MQIFIRKSLMCNSNENKPIKDPQAASWNNNVLQHNRGKLTLYRSAANFSMYCFILSAVFRPSWKKLKQIRVSNQVRTVRRHYRHDCISQPDKKLAWLNIPVCIIKQNGTKILYLLALCMIILNEVLQEVHSLLSLYLIHFDQVLFKTKEEPVRTTCATKLPIMSYYIW